MGMELLFLLLPLAALSGWWLGQRRSTGKRCREKPCPPHLNSRYFQGLNYLLDEQPDAALDIFIGISEVDSESVEIQFALASLFLRRGEVDRAIRIHQNLIARPTLSARHRQQALYALGMDYMSAGLLDRAENLFRELLDDPRHGIDSLKQLLAIFQQEKEWHKAIEVAQRIQAGGDQQLAPLVAQYYCELAEQALHKGELSQAEKHLQSAVGKDKNCVRASLLNVELLMRQGAYPQAIRICKQVEQQSPEYLPLILVPLRQCYEHLNQLDKYQGYLSELAQRHQNEQVSLALIKSLLKQGDTQTAERLLHQQLRQKGSLQGLSCLLEIAKIGGHGQHHWQQIHEVVDSLLQGKAGYLCRQCGYQGKNMLWQCPGCKQWNSIKPV